MCVRGHYKPSHSPGQEDAVQVHSPLLQEYPLSQSECLLQLCLPAGKEGIKNAQSNHSAEGQGRTPALLEHLFATVRHGKSKDYWDRLAYRSLNEQERETRAKRGPNGPRVVCSQRPCRACPILKIVALI